MDEGKEVGCNVRVPSTKAGSLRAPRDDERSMQTMTNYRTTGFGLVAIIRPYMSSGPAALPAFKFPLVYASRAARGHGNNDVS
jgi:hypothetical protein